MDTQHRMEREMEFTYGRQARPGEVIPVVRCRFCDQWTAMTETKVCDSCWEVEHRIEGMSCWQLLKLWLAVVLK